MNNTNDIQTDFLGVKAVLPTKRDAIFFDSILINKSVIGLTAITTLREVNDIEAEVAYLMEMGITRLLPEAFRGEPGYEGGIAPLRRSLETLKPGEDTSLLTSIGQELHARVLCIEAGLRGLPAVPILPAEPRLAGTRTIDVARILVNHLPVPTDAVPWEQIVDFRADKNARSNLRRLRKWMRTLDSEKLSAVEVHEELTYLLDEFEQYMNFHKMKFSREVLRTMVTFPFEAIENVIKLRLKNTVDAFYRISDARIALLESEMSAPGREVAYITQAHDVFQ